MGRAWPGRQFYYWCFFIRETQYIRRHDNRFVRKPRYSKVWLTSGCAQVPGIGLPKLMRSADSDGDSLIGWPMNHRRSLRASGPSLREFGREANGMGSGGPGHTETAHWQVPTMAGKADNCSITPILQDNPISREFHPLLLCEPRSDILLMSLEFLESVVIRQLLWSHMYRHHQSARWRVLARFSLVLGADLQPSRVPSRTPR